MKTVCVPFAECFEDLIRNEQTHAMNGKKSVVAGGVGQPKVVLQCK